MTTTVADLLRTLDDIVVVAPQTSIASVAACLTVTGAAVACVCLADGTLLGVVTRGDTRRGALSGSSEYGEWPISAVMTARPVTCTPQQSVDEVLDLLQTHEIRHLPVTEDGRLVGLLSLGDVLLHARSQAKRHVEFLTSFVFGAEFR